MSELPEETLQSIYIDFLFRDFLYIFKGFFTLKFSDGVILNKDD